VLLPNAPNLVYSIGVVMSVFECQMGEAGVGFLLKGMTVDSLMYIQGWAAEIQA